MRPEFSNSFSEPAPNSAIGRRYRSPESSEAETYGPATPLSHPDVEMIEADGLNADLDLHRSGLRLGKIDRLERLKSSVLSDLPGFHEVRSVP